MSSTPAAGATVTANGPHSATGAGLDELSYEQARDELIAVVTQLEQGGASLEESLVLWERGEALADRCEEWLIGAKARLDAARAGADGAGTRIDADASTGQNTDSSTVEAKDE